MKYPKKKWVNKEAKSKYGNKSCSCNLNHIHDSRFEARHCNHLGLLKRAGEISEFISQKRFDLHGTDGKKVASHFVDFLLMYEDGREEINECKSRGTVTAVWRLKKALTEHEYPNIPYTVVWM